MDEDIAAMTIEQWLDQAAQHLDEANVFFGHGTDNAWDEACWMVAHVAQLPPDFDDTMMSERLTRELCCALNDLLAKRIETKKPLAYLTGQAWFAGLEFKVNEDVLVPRSPMAELILNHLSPWLSDQMPKRVLDVGTGSGCLALAVAHHWPQVTAVVGVDVSPEALALAADNARSLGLQDKVTWIQSDVYEGLDGQTFDVILSNPPYVPTQSMASLPTEYTHEPVLGLEAGELGLDVVVRLVLGAKAHLSPTGILVCEVGEAWASWDAWAARHRLEIIWLDFEHGGEGVFLVSAKALETLDP